MQEGHNAQYYAEKQKHSTVVQFLNTWARQATKKVFDAMEAKDWNKVRDLIATTSWTPQALEEKHGVRIELVAIEYIILLYLKESVFAILLFFFIYITNSNILFVFSVWMFILELY